MTTNQIGELTVSLGGGPALRSTKYGQGFGLELAPAAGGAAPLVERFFWGGEFSTRFWIDPQHEIVSVIMTQILPADPGSVSVFRRTLESAIEE